MIILAFSFLQGYVPVSRAYLLGLQVAELAYPLVNRIPLFAILSIFGVCKVPDS